MDGLQYAVLVVEIYINISAPYCESTTLRNSTQWMV
jgi:hypothetical protein